MNPTTEKIVLTVVFVIGALLIIVLILAAILSFRNGYDSGAERYALIVDKCASMNQTMLPLLIVPEVARCYDSNGEIHEYLLRVE
jgi:hypothetical protein